MLYCLLLCDNQNLHFNCDIKEKPLEIGGDSLIAQSVKNLPAMQETWFQLLGEKDPMEKKMATHSSILAWRIQ